MNSFGIKSYLIFLRRNKLYTIINLIGFAVSLMFVIFITVYVVQETGTDSRNPKADRIYVLGNNDSYGNHMGLPYYIEGRYPQIETICTIARIMDMTANVRGESITAYPMFADPNFFDFFPFRIIDGDTQSPISGLSGVVLTQSFANKVFGNESPIGKTIELSRQESKSLVVTAVVEDLKNSFIASPDMITNLDNITFWEPEAHRTQLNRGQAWCITFLMGIEDYDLTQMAPALTEYFRTFYSAYYLRNNDSETYVTLTPLRKAYLRDDLPYYFYERNNGDLIQMRSKSMIRVLLFVGIVMLLFAAINYVNLTVAQTTLRAKEMASRRLFGAGRRRIFGTLIQESILMCLISFLLGLLMTYYFQAQFSSLLRTNVDVFASFSWELAAFFVALVIVLGVVSGLIPAIIILRFRPVDVVKGTFAYHSKQILSKIFIVVQYTVTIVLCVSSIVSQVQMRYMLDKPKGCNTENVLFANFFSLYTKYGDEKGLSIAENVYGEILKLPGVKRGGIIMNAPGMGPSYNGVRDMEDNLIWVMAIICDQDAFEILDFKTAPYDNGATVRNGSVWINRNLHNRLLSDGHPQQLFNFWPNSITGIVEDFVVSNSLDDDGIFEAVLVEDDLDLYWAIFEIQGDTREVFGQIKEIYEAYTDSDFKAQFIDDAIKESYKEITDQTKLVNIALLFTIIVSSLGLFAMSVYYINQRAGDIAIRKVFGSARSEILFRLTRKFLMFVAAAYVIAVSVSWWVMDTWLTQYSYRISLATNWWIFLAAGAFVFSAATLTVLWQSLRAANSNPVDAIKN